MKQYIVSPLGDGQYNAGSKARADVEKIASRMGYEPIPFEGLLTAEGEKKEWFSLLVHCLKNWKGLAKQAESGSIVLIQYPLFPLKTSFYMRLAIPWLKRRRNLRFIAVIHDMDSLRGVNGKMAFYSDRKILPFFDTIICHNTSMKEQLVKTGISSGKIVSLSIFDYLTEESELDHKVNDGIAVAGNLSPEKSGYLQPFISLSEGFFPVHLYGNGYVKEICGTWHGAFPPNQLPSVLEGGFGLVWDGSSEKTCTGGTGEYLRYNNPHKFSLYLASGMPVIIWDQAALTGFVKKYHLGLTVGSLEEVGKSLENVTEKEYQSMRSAVDHISRKVRSGFFMEKAIREAEKILQSKE